MLNSVIIMAKDTLFAEQIQELNLYAGLKVIGNGSTLLKDEEIESLKGEVDSSTRFHIIGPGYISTNGDIPRHLIDLFENNFYPAPISRDAISRIGKLVGGPVEVHCWSQYSSASVYLPTADLPEGSIFVTHDPYNQNMVKKLSQSKDTVFSEYFSKQRLLSPNPLVEKFIVESMIFAVKTMANLQLPKTEGVLDYNETLAFLPLGSNTGMRIIVNLAQNEETSKGAFELFFPVSSRANITSYEEVIEKVHTALSTKTAKNIVIPVKKPTLIGLDEVFVGHTKISDENSNPVLVTIFEQSSVLPELVDEELKILEHDDEALSTGTKFTKVLLLGPDLTLPETLKALYEDEQSIIIGNGIVPIENSDLVILKGKVNSNTRFDLMGHGLRWKETQHQIALYNSGCPVHLTKFITEKINTLVNSQAVELHIWSCYGGLAAGVVKFLEPGSIVFAHGPTDTEILNGGMMYGIEESIHYYTKFPLSRIDYSHSGSVHGLSIGIKAHDGSLKSLIFSPVITSDPTVVTQYFDLIKSTLANAIKAEVSESSYTQKEIEEFIKCLIEHHIYLKTEFSIIVESIIDRRDLQQSIFETLVCLEQKNELTDFLQELQKHNINIIDFFANDKKESLETTNNLMLHEVAKNLNILHTDEIQSIIAHHTRKTEYEEGLKQKLVKMKAKMAQLEEDLVKQREELKALTQPSCQISDEEVMGAVEVVEDL